MVLMPQDGTALLATYLRDAGGRAFEWGAHDCFTFAANWIALRHGIDPLAPWRGRYSTARGAQRHIMRGGGSLVAAASTPLEAAGFVSTDAPIPGDVGVSIGDLSQAFVIRAATGWVGLAPRGIVASSAIVALKAWTFPCPQSLSR